MYRMKYSLIFFLFISFWCIGIFSPAIFNHQEQFNIIKPFLNQVYATVCHQNHEKTVKIFGEHIFVCSRCLGIYLGLLFTSAISFFLVPRRLNFELMIFSLILMLGDVFLNTFKIYDYSKVIALLTGFMFGSALLFFVLSVFKSVCYEK